MALLEKKTLLLAKVESTYGTDPTPTKTADAILCKGLEISTPIELIDRDDMYNGTLSPSAPAFARNYFKMDFTVELKGSGAAGTAPDVSPLIQACGFAETVTPATNVVYAPTSLSTMKSVTIYAYRDGLLYKMKGARGTMSINAQVGKAVEARFSFTGLYAIPTDVAFPTGPTFDTTVGVALKSASFSIGGYAAVMSSFGVDVGNQLTITDDMNSATGYGQVLITARTMQGSIDPEAVLLGTKDYWTALTSSTQQALTITAGATAGNIVTIAAPKVVQRDIQEQNRGGVYAYQIPITCAANAGDDELTITLT